MKHIDTDKLSEIAGDDLEFQKELLEIFVSSSQELVELIRQAASERDVSSLLHASHSLKGSSRSVGANKFGALCEVLEKEARAGSTLVCVDQLLEFEREYKSVISEAMVIISRAA